MPPTDSAPAARKINPSDIPAGHVELGGGDRLAVSSADFQEDNPEAFIGRTVKGRYVITDLLGGEEGSFAFVADDKLVDDKKVLVRILLDYEEDEILGSILDEERVSLSHVSHPNIARLIDSGQFTDRTRFLISEYIDALSVNDILGIHGVFDVTRAARIIRQVSFALNEVHQEGILHRDLRPTSIIVTPGDGEAEQVTLVNFGASSGQPTRYNMAYKAPEVLDGRISTIASDVYSLAVVAYQMVTGQLPFKGNSAKEIMRAQYEGPTKASSIRPELPRGLDAVFEKALAFEVPRRYGKARDLGDAIVSALAEAPKPVKAPISVEAPRAIEPPSVLEPPPAPVVTTDKDDLELDKTPPSSPVVPATPEPKLETVAPAAPEPKFETVAPAVKFDEPTWTRRTPEPAEVSSAGRKWIPAALAVAALLVLFALGWYFMSGRRTAPEVAPVINSVSPANTTQANTTVPVANTQANPTVVAGTDGPPPPRAIVQPANTNYYQNSKQNLKGDLLRNFVGFSLYYPKNWKVNGPQESVAANTRGKFLDISSNTPDNKLKEQMLISYYPSKGTFEADKDKFPQLVKESNETLKKILPGYQSVAEGEIKFNGEWRAYEVKFQAAGQSATGEKVFVWGRRLFIPAARPDARNGFEITMLATSAAENVRGVDDVGVRGELAAILYSFEPNQNF
jgi:serine/threonine protein kinase